MRKSLKEKMRGIEGGGESITLYNPVFELREKVAAAGRGGQEPVSL